jgi:serine protease Do
MSRLASKTVNLSYGLFAIILLATLLLGLLSGGWLGGLAVSHVAGRSTPGAAQPPASGRVWIGITYVPVTAALARSSNLPVNKGALIVAVTPNSPAASAGLREEDIITSVDQRVIDDTTSVMDVIMQKKLGDRIQVTFLRDGKEQTVDITLGRVPTRGTAPDGGTPLDRLRRGFARFAAGQ